MKMSLHSYFLSRNSRVPDCLEWEIIKTYDFSSNAGAPTRLDYNYFYCDNYNPFPYNKLSFWVEVITLVLSVVAFFVNSFLLFERILFYCKKKKQNPNLTLDIRKYMVHWFFIAILGNVLNVVGILFLLVKINEDTITYGHSFLGFGAFFTCVAVIRNYYHYPKFYVISFHLTLVPCKCFGSSFTWMFKIICSNNSIIFWICNGRYNMVWSLFYKI